MGPPAKTYSGPLEGIDLSRIQERNYEALQAILQRNGDAIHYIGYAAYPGMPAYNAGPNSKPTLTTFVGIANSLVWEKYEGQTAGGGRNTVYVGGRAMKLTDFLKLDPKKQDALVSMGPGEGEADELNSIPKDKQNTQAMIDYYKDLGQYSGDTTERRLYNMIKKGWDKLTPAQKIWFAKEAQWIQ
jgi:hypothetical protein